MVADIKKWEDRQQPKQDTEERERGEDALKILAEYTARECEAGRTISLRDYAAKRRIPLDGE
jgi:hypothetical protein